MTTSPGTTFAEFIRTFEATLKSLFHEKNDIDKLSAERGLPPEMWSDIMADTPLSVSIPQQYGGRGSSVKDILTLLTVTSYESLPLTLTFGINIGLFLGPVAKYADDSVKKEIFDRFLINKHMGGMMITEPMHGSDALNIKTAYRPAAGGYHVHGLKHWQGLTGLAEYWLIAARKETGIGKLTRDLDFFICDTTQPGQQIIVEEYFDALGLYMIPYGRNRVDVQVPRQYKLQPHSTGLKMMLDILHRSRMQFPGMGMGFIKRMLDEALTHCRERVVGAANLMSIDQVNFMVSRIQSAYTICAAMCVRSSAISSIDNDLSAEGLEANSIKAVVTDLMQESAQIMVQLSGAGGYRISNIGGRGIMDSRPFQIFEGANELLYTQVADTITRLMKKQEEFYLFDFFKNFKLTSESCKHFKKELGFTLAHSLSQRKLYDLGKIFSKIVSVGYVIQLGDKGFRNDLIDSCITNVKQEVASLISSFRFDNKVKAAEDYADNSIWFNFC